MSSETKWRAGNFTFVYGDKLTNERGYLYRGLGLFHGVGAHLWMLIHIGSGHTVAYLEDAKREKVFLFASELAELGDWTFHGIKGYENSDPDLVKKRNEWIERYSPDVFKPKAKGNFELADIVARLVS